MSSGLRKLIALALLCTATAVCNEAQGGFLAPELNNFDGPANSSSASGDDGQSQDREQAELPSPSLEKPVGMTGQTTPSHLASGGAFSVCVLPAIRLQLIETSNRLWVGTDRTSPSLGFQLEILRPPRV
jgi:hypothetical protein